MKQTVITSLMRAALCTGCAVLPLLAGGCATTGGIEATGTVLADKNPTGLYKSIVINNSSLAGDLEIADMKSDSVGDLLMVQVSLRSKSRDNVLIQYKFDWFDTRGFEIRTNQGWTPLMIYGRETVTIQTLAPNREAREFKLKIREQDDPEI